MATGTRWSSFILPVGVGALFGAVVSAVLSYHYPPRQPKSKSGAREQTVKSDALMRQESVPVSPTEGGIDLIAGPMRCGKSTELKRRLDNHRMCCRRNIGQKCLLIKYSKDTRFHPTAFATRGGIVDHHCVATDDLVKVQLDAAKSNYIFVDEGQFMKNLSLCIEWARAGKRVTIAMLDFDTSLCMWPEFIAILPYCRNKLFLKAVCEECGQPDSAIVTQSSRHMQPGERRISDDDYTVLCTHCFELPRPPCSPPSPAVSLTMQPQSAGTSAEYKAIDSTAGGVSFVSSSLVVPTKAMAAGVVECEATESAANVPAVSAPMAVPVSTVAIAA